MSVNTGIPIPPGRCSESRTGCCPDNPCLQKAWARHNHGRLNPYHQGLLRSQAIRRIAKAAAYALDYIIPKEKDAT